MVTLEATSEVGHFCHLSVLSYDVGAESEVVARERIVAAMDVGNCIAAVVSFLEATTERQERSKEPLCLKCRIAFRLTE